VQKQPNGWRYPLVGGTRQRYFIGINSKPRKLPKTAQTPTSRVHAVLARFLIARLYPFNFARSSLMLNGGFRL
jgi:hypothetical protein